MSSIIAIVAEDIGEANLARLRAEFPSVVFESCLDEASFAAVAPQAEIVFSKRVYPAALEQAQALRWVQTGTAGVERWLNLNLHARGIRLSNASGVHGTPMSEVILGMMFAFATGLHTLIRHQSSRGSVKAQVLAEKFELAGQTVCVIGLGDIGGALARRCGALGMRVIGVRRTQEPLAFVDQLYPVQERQAAMAAADHVALCLPLTQATTNIVDEPELRAMQSHAYIYNVGRGASINAPALNRALAEGWIAGAGLDVTDPEPLPSDSFLWDAPNVILSLHTSGDSPPNADRITQRFAENLHRYLAGEPLEYEIDPEREY